MLQTLIRRRPTRPDLAIDLGTARTKVLADGSDIVFDEPSLCCFKAYDAVPAFVAAGLEAERFVGRVSKPLKMVSPLHNGVVSDMDAARELIRYAIRQVRPKRALTRVRALFGVPADASAAERRALIGAAMDAGISDPEVLPEPILAAAGAGLDIDTPRGRMIIDCGAGVAEAVVISLGGICAAASTRGGGDELTRSIVDHFRTERRFRIGFATAEKLKLEVSEKLAGGATEAAVSVGGLAASSGLPQRLEVPLSELAPVWERDLAAIVQMVRRVLSATPPELSQDILEDGILLTGGGAYTALLSRRIEESAGISTRIAERPQEAVAHGLAVTMAGMA
jgi:rod shape-determining protein MreB and related proteins